MDLDPVTSGGTTRKPLTRSATSSLPILESKEPVPSVNGLSLQSQAHLLAKRKAECHSVDLELSDVDSEAAESPSEASTAVLQEVEDPLVSLADDLVDVPLESTLEALTCEQLLLEIKNFSRRQIRVLEALYDLSSRMSQALPSAAASRTTEEPSSTQAISRPPSQVQIPASSTKSRPIGAGLSGPSGQRISFPISSSLASTVLGASDSMSFHDWLCARMSQAQATRPPPATSSSSAPPDANP